MGDLTRLPSGEPRMLIYRGQRVVPHWWRSFGWFATVGHWDVEHHEVQIDFEQDRVFLLSWSFLISAARRSSHIGRLGALVKSDPGTILKFLTGYFKSIEWTRAHPEEALRAFLEIQKKDVGVEISMKVAQTLHSHTEWLPVDVQLATLFNKNYGEGSLYVDAPFILGFFAKQGVDVKPIPMDGVIDASFLMRVLAANKR